MGSRDGAAWGHPINSWKGLVTFCKRTEFRSVQEVDCPNLNSRFACKITKWEIHTVFAERSKLRTGNTAVEFSKYLKA